MPTLVQALEQLEAALTAALPEGVAAAVDENDVPVPGAWINVRTVSYPTLGREVRWRVDVLLIVGAGSTGPALEQLEQLHNLVVPAVLVPDDDPEFVTVGLPSDPSIAYPALRLPVDLDL